MASNFRTTVEVPQTSFGLKYGSRAMLIGSCFAQNMGEMLLKRKFGVLVNPFGVVYNPMSVKMVLKRVMEGRPFVETELDFHNGRWFSFMHYTAFSDPDKHLCLSLINRNLSEAHRHWENTGHLVVTFGTSRVYFHKHHNKPVANCHKIPSAEFDHRLLSVKEIVDVWGNLLDEMLRQKPSLKVAFSVSPVRHWKDGATGNLVSKSTLVLAVHELVRAFPNHTLYFPSYEIMMDDLRDYRFYANDMLHPSPLAIEYIWEKFIDACIDSTSRAAMAETERVLQALEHRVQRPGSAEHKRFISITLTSLRRLAETYPEIDFSAEIETLNRQFN